MCGSGTAPGAGQPELRHQQSPRNTHPCRGEGSEHSQLSAGNTVTHTQWIIQCSQPPANAGSWKERRQQLWAVPGAPLLLLKAAAIFAGATPPRSPRSDKVPKSFGCSSAGTELNPRGAGAALGCLCCSPGPWVSPSLVPFREGQSALCSLQRQALIEHCSVPLSDDRHGTCGLQVDLLIHLQLLSCWER